MAVALKSSFLVSADYDPVHRILTVALKSGKSYEYAGVPIYVYQGLLLAKSAGKYYGAEIRGKYQAPNKEEP